MRTSRTGTSTRCRGLTLIELIAAITIVALVTSLAVPSAVRTIDRARFDRAARDIVTGLRQARRTAIAEQRDIAFALNVESGQAFLDDAAYPLRAPSGLDFAMTAAVAETTGPELGAIRFFPDGSATGGQIDLVRDEAAVSIAIDWLTGQVELTR